MKQIKQIQLRGISRTPSDRMTEDGGCAESLNFQLEDKESAPIVDATPMDLAFQNNVKDIVYIHKQPTYTNYICIDDDGLVAYTKEGKKIINSSVSSLEEIASITSLGNTISYVQSSNSEIKYFLYKGYQYYDCSLRSLEKLSITTYPGSRVSLYEESAGTSKNIEVSPGQTVRNALFETIKSCFDKNIKPLWSSRFVRVALKYYDGEIAALSEPKLLVSTARNETFKGDYSICKSGVAYENDVMYLALQLVAWSYTFRIKIDNLRVSPDIIKEVSIYVTPPTQFIHEEEQITPNDQPQLRDLVIDYDEENRIVDDSRIYYLIESFEVPDNGIIAINKLYGSETSALDELPNVYLRKQELLLTQPQLDSYAYDCNIKNRAHSLMVYNSRMLEFRPIVELWKTCGICQCEQLASNEEIPAAVPYYVRFIMENQSSVITEECVPYEHNAPSTWLFYPDKNCKFAEIYYPSTGKYITVEMKEHPYVFGSYCFFGNRIKYPEGTKNYTELPECNDTYERYNYIYQSEVDNPFTFPISYRYSLPARVQNIATTTKALSTGQFGQYPLYAFTSEGIYALAIASDGTFSDCKPLSRTIAEEDAVFPIDQAIVFVTTKGVMVLSSSDIENISKYMHGKHYKIEDDAKTILNSKGFSQYSDILSDDTPFMSFINGASMTYDAEGDRLIFFNKTEEYAYVFRLVTETWHKLSLPSGMKFRNNINSYPKALSVMTKQVNIGNKKYLIRSDDFVDYFDELYQNTLAEYGQQLIQDIYKLAHMQIDKVDVTRFSASDINAIIALCSDSTLYLNDITGEPITKRVCSLYDYSTELTDSRIYNPTASSKTSIIVTRPFDLGTSDTYKSISEIKIRGHYGKGRVKWMLLGSNDGENFKVLHSLKGQSWKLYRLIITANLRPYERISWVDVEYEERFANRLR